MWCWDAKWRGAVTLNVALEARMADLSGKMKIWKCGCGWTLDGVWVFLMIIFGVLDVFLVF